MISPRFLPYISLCLPYISLYLPMPHQDLGQAAEEEEERRRLPSRAGERGVRLLALMRRGDGAW